MALRWMIKLATPGSFLVSTCSQEEIIHAGVRTKKYKQDSTFCVEGINEAGTGSKGTLELDIMAKPTFIRNLPPKTGYLSYSDQVELICQVI